MRLTRSFRRQAIRATRGRHRHMRRARAHRRRGCARPPPTTVAPAASVGAPAAVTQALAGLPQPWWHPAGHSRPGRHPSTSVHGLKQVTFDNWSGYADDNSTGKTYTAVSGAWKQPTITCPKNEDELAVWWVGLDGFNNGTVEQDGTMAWCFKGTPAYYTWWEMFPTNSIQIVGSSVKPGDTIAASVNFAVEQIQPDHHRQHPHRELVHQERGVRCGPDLQALECRMDRRDAGRRARPVAVAELRHMGPHQRVGDGGYRGHRSRASPTTRSRSPATMASTSPTLARSPAAARRSTSRGRTSSDRLTQPRSRERSAVSGFRLD